MTELNGEEVARRNITSKLMNEYSKFLIKEEYSAKIGDELIAYVVAEDSAGYIHKTLARYWIEVSFGTG